MSARGSSRERASEAWIEMRENPGRSVLQALGVILGVAAVLGGFSISDSMRRQSERLFAKMGGTDKLNVMPREAPDDMTLTANRSANLGLRMQDANEGFALPSGKGIEGVSVLKETRARVRSEFADEERRVTGIDADYLPINGYQVEQGRAFSNHDLESGSPVAILGTQAAAVLFPTGVIVGQRIRIGDVPVEVIGVLSEKVFRFRGNQGNMMAWRNRIVAVPARLVARRMQGDTYARLDRITFRFPDLDQMASFSKELSSLVTANHRLQRDFRLDNVAKRIEKQRSQGDVYNIIFMLSGILSLIGGGMVNVNIQLASLKDRVREVGVKMAIGAPGREIFLSFMTEALLLTGLGSLAGLLVGIAFSKVITASIETPLSFAPMSFVWAVLLAGIFGFVFALYPAWKASRLSPMEALRYE